MREDTLELFHSQDILVDTETHSDAIDTLLDVHIANSVGPTATVAISYVADNALALTRLHRRLALFVYYEGLFSPLGDIHEVECYQRSMGVDLNPERSILHAQVRKAKASHCVDDAGSFLRPSTFKGPSSKVYLGDVAETLLRCSAGAETPTFSHPPGFDEQRWIMEYTAGSLHVSIQSVPYWGFGLLTSGYRNEVVIRGPVEERSRLVHDWVAALQHNPWEFAHRGSAKKALHAASSSLKANEDNWRSHQTRARSVLAEAIASLEHHIDRMEKKGDVDANMINLARLEIDLAQQALADDNTPAVERALSRGEAALLLPIEEDDIDVDGAILTIEDDIPFVDLTDDASE